MLILKKENIQSLKWERMAYDIQNEAEKCLIHLGNELNKKVAKLSDEVSTGKGMVRVLVFLGTIAAACLGYFNWR